MTAVSVPYIYIERERSIYIYRERERSLPPPWSFVTAILSLAAILPQPLANALGTRLDCTIKMFVCLLDNVTMCLERLTVQDKEKEIFNGKVVEPLVLLVEVCSIDNHVGWGLRNAGSPTGWNQAS